jgi:hypothetical protein
MKIVFITDLNTFGSKLYFTLKTMDFEYVPLIKNYSCLGDRRHEHIIYMI